MSRILATWLALALLPRFVSILSALLTYYCRPVSSFSDARAGIRGFLMRCGNRDVACGIERVQKSAENEYSSGNGHFSRPPLRGDTSERFIHYVPDLFVVVDAICMPVTWFAGSIIFWIGDLNAERRNYWQDRPIISGTADAIKIRSWL